MAEIFRIVYRLENLQSDNWRKFSFLAWKELEKLAMVFLEDDN